MIGVAYHPRAWLVALGEGKEMLFESREEARVAAREVYEIFCGVHVWDYHSKKAPAYVQPDGNSVACHSARWLRVPGLRSGWSTSR